MGGVRSCGSPVLERDDGIRITLRCDKHLTERKMSFAKSFVSTGKGQRKGLRLFFAFAFFTAAINAEAAVPRREVSDEQIVAQGQLVARGTSVDIYQHAASVAPSFLKVMEAAYEQIRKVTELNLDTETLGPKVSVYVSEAVGISHVWKGYQHPSDPKAIIFLNPRVYLGATNGKNATHIHELTHLFTWRFSSHTLREGFADYVALKILPGAAVGPNRAGESPAEIPAEVLQLLGTTKPAPEWASTDPVRRSAYYFASYRFVKFLIEAKGMETFMKLYASEKPETDIKSLYGMVREEAVEAALGARS
jgi:hypothetical protein